MRYLLKPLALAISSLAVLTLHGCGGGGSDAPASPPDDQPAATASISGVVLDGVLAGATVCLDLNDNRDCDATEPATTTTATGSYTLDGLTEAQAKGHPVLAKVVAGTTTADAAPVGASYMLAAPAGMGAVITPYTTLVLSEIDGGRAPNRAQAEEGLLSNLVGTAGDVGGLTLYSNYVGDTTVGTATQRG